MIRGDALAARPPRTSPFHVVLVDDDDDIRVAVRRSLRSSEYLIHEASDGAEALRHFERGPVHLIVSDFGMPAMNGLDLLQRVRLSYPETVRILLTGQTDIAIAARALNEGSVHRFFLKPWDAMDLQVAVRIALHSHFGPEP